MANWAAENRAGIASKLGAEGWGQENPKDSPLKPHARRPADEYNGRSPEVSD
jgi:hypothetical protein